MFAVVAWGIAASIHLFNLANMERRDWGWKVFSVVAFVFSMGLMVKAIIVYNTVLIRF